MPKSSLRQLVKFMRVFGVGPGFRLWLSVMWQLRTRAGQLAIRIPGGAGPIQLRPQDLQIFWQIMVMQENDFAAWPQAKRAEAAYQRLLAEGKRPVVVDCGGHIGLSALWFALHFPEAVVYSVEPDAANFALLQENTKAYRNVVPMNGGIWSRPSYLEISNPDSGSASFRLREVAEAVGANVLRGYAIEEIAGQKESDRLFLVKMDIEGAEAEVFRGEAGWLRSAAVVIVELHDWLMPGQGTSRNLLARVAENEFDVLLRGENVILFQTGAE